MKIFKYVILLLVFGVLGFANDVEEMYTCPPYALESAVTINANGEKTTHDVNEVKKRIEKIEKYGLKTNWYGKPLYLNWYKKKNREPLILSNTQSKLEWIQSDVMIFELDITEKNGERIQVKLSLEKGNTPIMKNEIKMSSPRVEGGTGIMTQRCFKQ